MMILVLALLLAFGFAASIGGQYVDMPSQSVTTGLANLLAIGIALSYGLRRSSEPASGVLPLKGVDPLLFAVTIVTASGLAVLLSEVDNILRYFLPIPGFVSEILTGFYKEGDLLGSLFLLVIVAPLTEEFLFRGLVLHGFLKNYKPVVAVAVSSFLFGLIHLNPWQFTSGFLLGIFLGWIFIITGSLIPCLAVHAFFNGLPFLFMHVIDVKIPGLTTGLNDHHSFQPLWLDLAGLAVSAAGIYLIYMMTRSRNGAGV